MTCDYWQLESKVKKIYERRLHLPLAGKRKSRNTERVLGVTIRHGAIHPRTFRRNRQLGNFIARHLIVAATRILTPQNG